MGGCEPERTGGSCGAAGAGTCFGEGGDVDGTRGGGVPGVGEKPGIGGMVNLLPSLLQVEVAKFSQSDSELYSW